MNTVASVSFFQVGFSQVLYYISYAPHEKLLLSYTPLEKSNFQSFRTNSIFTKQTFIDLCQTVLWVCKLCFHSKGHDIRQNCCIILDIIGNHPNDMNNLVQVIIISKRTPKLEE